MKEYTITYQKEEKVPSRSNLPQGTYSLSIHIRSNPEIPIPHEYSSPLPHHHQQDQKAKKPQQQQQQQHEQQHHTHLKHKKKIPESRNKNCHARISNAPPKSSRHEV
jgi:hypothetical protein